MDAFSMLQQPGTDTIVDLRQLHAMLKAKSRFRDWVKRRIRQHKFQIEVDYCTKASECLTANDGRPRIDYFAPKRTAAHIAMTEKGEMGIQARKYFIKCEETVQVHRAVDEALEETVRLLRELQTMQSKREQGVTH